MEKRLKAKWVRALRSGRYKQTGGDLKNAEGYCCLGVLCSVAGARWTGEEWGGLKPILRGKVIKHEDEELLSPSFRRQVGLTKRRQSILTDMNDGGHDKDNVWQEPKSFAEIADYIEKNL